MREARRRVRLAVRLDEVVRRGSKARADVSWRRRAAEEVGIDLSDDSGDEGEWYFLYYQQLSILMIFGVLAMKGTIELKTFG
jgi:hypothetical protein